MGPERPAAVPIPPPQELAEKLEAYAPPRPVQEVVDEVIRMAGSCAVFTRSMVMGRAKTYDEHLLKAAFFAAWRQDPRVSTVEVNDTGDCIYEITYTPEDRQNLNTLLELHQQVLHILGGPDHLYRKDWPDVLGKVKEKVRPMLPADVPLSENTMLQIIKSRTMGEYEIFQWGQSWPSPAADAVSSSGKKRRDPSKEVPSDFTLPYPEATCEELHGLPWRVATGEPAYATVGNAIDAFVGRRSQIVSLHWRGWIMNQIIGRQPVERETIDALVSGIFRDSRFIMLGMNTFGNTLHKLEPALARDTEDIWRHEMLAQRIVDFLRHNRIKGSHPPQKLARVALEALNIRVRDWDLRYLGWLMEVQEDVVSHGSPEESTDIRLQIRSERQRRVRRRRSDPAH